MAQATTFGRRVAVAPPQIPARPSSRPPQAYAPPPGPTAEPQAKNASAGSYFLWMLFAFNGRLSRTNYRYCRIAANLLFLLAVYGLASAMAKNAGNLGMQSGLVLIGMGLSVLMIWTTLAMQVKRRHDRDKGWAWLFVGFIPIVGPLWVLIETCWLDGTPGYNRFDDPTLDFG